MIGFKQVGDAHYVPPSVRTGDGGDTHVADYMFGEVPEADPEADAVAATLAAMDANGVQVGMLALMSDGGLALRAVADHPDRFVLCTHVDPTDVMGAVAQIRADHRAHRTRAVSFFPSGTQPPTAVDDARAYPVYATCVELGLPVFVNAGVPGPRSPMASQHVAGFDRVCYDFPDLALVMRHGAEPWEELAVKLMLKWPNLHYSTSAFSPKYYPRPVVEYANTRGADKVLYGGYHPFALDLTRIFDDLAAVPFRDHVWPKFLHDNAARLLRLD